MRISDWSSDVCSSDLPDGGQGFRKAREAPPRKLLDRRAGRGDRGEHAAHPAGRKRAAAHRRGARRRSRRDLGEARKSVVSGKSVSVRVDLGGGGIITKNRPYPYYFFQLQNNATTQTT